MSHKRENSPDHGSNLTRDGITTKLQYTNWTSWRRQLLGDYPLARCEIKGEARTDWNLTRPCQARLVTYLKKGDNGVQTEATRPWNAARDDTELNNRTAAWKLKQEKYANQCSRIHSVIMNSLHKQVKSDFEDTQIDTLRGKNNSFGSYCSEEQTDFDIKV
jgi:hypothetical protein